MTTTRLVPHFNVGPKGGLEFYCQFLTEGDNWICGKKATYAEASGGNSDLHGGFSWDSMTFACPEHKDELP